MNLAAKTIQHATRESLSRDRAADLVALGGQLVDVRPAEDFRRNALPGALNLPVDSLCYDHRKLNSKRPVIVYGASGYRSSRAARLLAGKGFSSIYHLADAADS